MRLLRFFVSFDIKYGLLVENTKVIMAVAADGGTLSVNISNIRVKALIVSERSTAAEESLVVCRAFTARVARAI